MAIFLTDKSRVLVQGITGTEGTRHTRRMVAAGTTVVAGVTPGKGGQDVDGIPVFDSAAAAAEETGADTSVVFVPPRFAKAAVIEAIDAELSLAVVLTEGIPVHDTAAFWAHAQAAGNATRIIGPNCPGLISPGRSNAGSIPAGSGFVFAVKGGRFITHNLKLRNAEASLGNFFASGVLALGERTGPFLWQLPDTYRFDAERMDAFMRLLPRTSREGEAVARQHDERLRRGALVEAAADVPYRHAFEVRHPTYFHDEFYAILRAHGFALVFADTAGRWPYAEELTADFAYVRLHGSQQLYVSGYADAELDDWVARIRRWQGARRGGRDVYVYFDNDAKVHAPFDAMRLRERVR